MEIGIKLNPGTTPHQVLSLVEQKGWGYGDLGNGHVAIRIEKGKTRVEEVVEAFGQLGSPDPQTPRHQRG